MAVFAIDFDGTIVTDKYPEIGDIIPEALDGMNELKKYGHKIIIWTCRSDNKLVEMKDFLMVNNIPFDYINENCPVKVAYYNNNSRKVGADYYIDDRMIGKWSWEDVKAIARK